MSKVRDWSLTAKLLTLSLVGLLLSIGLCAAGGGFDTHVTQLQIAMTYAGGFLFVAAIVTFVYAASSRNR
jgi:hypothetical protein